MKNAYWVLSYFLIKSQSLHTFEGNDKDADSSPELSASVFLKDSLIFLLFFK